MKKIAALLVSALICAYSFAVDKPWLSISVETPKKFFSDVSDIMRKVYPDPQLEMTLALMLSQFGSTRTSEGIDPKENFALAAFGKASAPQLFMAVKASKDSAIYKFAEHANCARRKKTAGSYCSWTEPRKPKYPTTSTKQYRPPLKAFTASLSQSATQKNYWTPYLSPSFPRKIRLEYF